MLLKLSTNELKKEHLPQSLSQGAVVPIIMENNDGTYICECKAVLLERLSSWFIPEPFPFIEYSETDVVNAIKEKWKVMVKSDSVFDNGRKMVRWVYRFHSTGIISIREDVDQDIETEDQDDLNDLI